MQHGERSAKFGLRRPRYIHTDASGGAVPHRIVERNDHTHIWNVCVQVVPREKPSLGEELRNRAQFPVGFTSFLCTCYPWVLPNYYVPKKAGPL